MSESGTEQNGLIYIYWAACKQCGYTTAVHGRARCPDCDMTLAPYAIAGAVVDGEERSVHTDTDRDIEEVKYRLKKAMRMLDSGANANAEASIVYAWNALGEDTAELFEADEQ